MLVVVELVVVVGGRVVVVVELVVVVGGRVVVVVAGRVVVVVADVVLVVVVVALVVVVDAVVLVDVVDVLAADVVVDELTGRVAVPSLDGTQRRNQRAGFHTIPCRRVVSATLTWKHNISDGPLTAGTTPVGTHSRDGLVRRTDIRLPIVSDAGDAKRADVADGYRTDAHVYCVSGVAARCTRDCACTAVTVHVERRRCCVRSTGVGPAGPVGLNSFTTYTVAVASVRWRIPSHTSRSPGSLTPAAVPSGNPTVTGSQVA